jgi:hypothetical protein
MPESITNTVFQINLPSDTSFVSASIYFVGAQISYANPIVVGQSSLNSYFFTSVVSNRVRITVDFGILEDMADNKVNAQDTIVIEVTFNINDVPANLGLSPANRMVTLDASVLYTNTLSRSNSASQKVTVLEPHLINSISHNLGFQTNDARDTVTYTFKVQMTATSAAPAYRVWLLYSYLFYLIVFINRG